MMHSAEAARLVGSVAGYIYGRNTGKAGEYTMCAGGEVTLYSSCFAAMMLHYIKRLDAFTSDEKLQWIDYINKWQDKETGLYLGPEIVEGELTSLTHDREHITMHLAAHVLPALSLLGGRPAYPLSFAHRFLDKNELLSWLEARNWSKAWLEGNNLIFIGQFLIHLRDVEGKREAAELLKLYFDWLDTQVDPATGLWGTNGFCSPFIAMCGGYHQLLVYYYEGRGVSYKERLVDAVLALQHDDGGFSPSGGGGACEDVDAVDILVNMYKRADYRRAEIMQALRRALPNIRRNQMPDGGFVYRLNQSFTHMGILKTQSPANVSNMFATWFRVHTLALIGEVLVDEPQVQFDWQFNDTCSMGWHRKGIEANLEMLRFEEHQGIQDTAVLTNTIIVAGSGRSGTTWLGNVIAGDDCRILFEPFDFRHVPELAGLGLRPYFRPDAAYPQWKPIVARILSGNLQNDWIDQDKGRLSKSNAAARLVVKEIRANGMLGWIDRNFSCKIVYLVRHPGAVIASRLKLKWDTHIDYFLAQPELMSDYLAEYEEVLKSAKTELQKHAVMWCVENIVPLRQMKGYNWIFCKYEHLVLNPDKELGRILPMLGLEYTECRKKTVDEFSRTCFVMDGRDQLACLSEWRKSFSETDLQEISNILKKFGIGFYD